MTLVAWGVGLALVKETVGGTQAEEQMVVAVPEVATVVVEARAAEARAVGAMVAEGKAEGFVVALSVEWVAAVGHPKVTEVVWMATARKVVAAMAAGTRVVACSVAVAVEAVALEGGGLVEVVMEEGQAEMGVLKECLRVQAAATKVVAE